MTEEEKARKGKEMIKIFAILTAAYPRFDIFQDKERLKPVINLWAELLGDLEYSAIEAAVKKLILESPFPPTIADVRKLAIEIMTSPEEKVNAAEAWGEVERAIRLYGYYRESEALASMSPRVAKVVKYLGWQEICLSEEPGVVRGQFLKMYAQVAEREQKERLLPASLKEDIKRLSENMSMKMLEGGKQDDEEHWLAIQ